jgi:hypothetical protein
MGKSSCTLVRLFGEVGAVEEGNVTYTDRRSDMGHHTLYHSRPVSINQWSLARRDNSIPSIRRPHCFTDRHCSSLPAVPPSVSAVGCNAFNCDTQGLAAVALRCQISVLISRESAHPGRDTIIRSSSNDKRNSCKQRSLILRARAQIANANHLHLLPRLFALASPRHFTLPPGATIGGSLARSWGAAGGGLGGLGKETVRMTSAAITPPFPLLPFSVVADIACRDERTTLLDRSVYCQVSRIYPGWNGSKAGVGAGAIDGCTEMPHSLGLGAARFLRSSLRISLAGLP